MISNFLTQYLPPILLAVIVMLAILLAIAILARGGSVFARMLWRGILQQRLAIGFLCFALLFIVAFATFVVRSNQSSVTYKHAEMNYDTPANLISTSYLPVAPLTHTVMPLPPPEDGKAMPPALRSSAVIVPQTLLATNVIIVQPGQHYAFTLRAATKPSIAGLAQIRELWFGPSFNLLSYKDNVPWNVDPGTQASPDSTVGGDGIHLETYTAPPGATRLQLEVRNIGTTALALSQITLSDEGVYVEPSPNGTQGSIAFSFDWESTMGGPVHSQGMTVHDVAGATQHGLLMRQGADWLNTLFQQNNIHATFYATGYDLLDGNTEHRTFSGNPTYKWASPKDNWNSSYWLTHPWYSDDPFGTYQTDPAWYFGDQTRTLLAAGDEIATHTFGHIYVRGSNPTELGTDLDEWLKAAQAQGVPPPTTFAFPWRSSNSVTSDFYQVLYDRRIRAVTRLYAPDLRDLYTLGAAPVYSYMAVMPDFLLGSASSSAGEESSGAEIGLDQGIAVITETLARRGTTSFWNHPEQMGDLPALQPARATWTGVVQAAARERDAGRLWIATVAQIIAYQRDVMSVTVSLNRGPSGTWQMLVTNNAGHPIDGLTLTLPGDATALSSSDAELRTVIHPTPDHTSLSPPGKPAYPARQLVVTSLKPGSTTINVTWASGQEPLQ